ncbi:MULTISPECIES: hypothetical protein [Frankia]|uniref:hypothetical protein n=1 Tax=Frankia TaxID=1854 RepID=UPI001F5B575D|nr:MULTISPECIES: hypothetical protein [Frankia]
MVDGAYEELAQMTEWIMNSLAADRVRQANCQPNHRVRREMPPPAVGSREPGQQIIGEPAGDRRVSDAIRPRRRIQTI